MAGCRITGLTLGALVILWWCATVAVGTEATDDGDATNILPCLETLTPCQPDLGSETVSQECCDQLNEMMHHDPKCICSMFYNDDLLENFNVTRQQTVDMASKCQANVGHEYCSRYIDATARQKTLSSLAMGSIISPSAAEVSKAVPHDELASLLVVAVMIYKMIL